MKQKTKKSPEKYWFWAGVAYAPAPAHSNRGHLAKGEGQIQCGSAFRWHRALPFDKRSGNPISPGSALPNPTALTLPLENAIRPQGKWAQHLTEIDPNQIQFYNSNPRGRRHRIQVMPWLAIYPKTERLETMKIQVRSGIKMKAPGGGDASANGARSGRSRNDVDRGAAAVEKVSL